jgi:hypothetical protein
MKNKNLIENIPRKKPSQLKKERDNNNSIIKANVD